MELISYIGIDPKLCMAALSLPYSDGWRDLNLFILFFYFIQNKEKLIYEFLNTEY